MKNKQRLLICGIISALVFTMAGCKNPFFPEPINKTFTVTVTFNSNGGTAVAPITEISGSTITLPTPPTKDGYTFSGWFTDNESFANEFTSSTSVNENITVFAKWTSTVTFDSNEGSSVEPITGITDHRNYSRLDNIITGSVAD